MCDCCCLVLTHTRDHAKDHVENSALGYWASESSLRAVCVQYNDNTIYHALSKRSIDNKICIYLMRGSSLIRFVVSQKQQQ